MIKVLVPHGYAPSGWGVAQEGFQLWVTTPCCGARVNLYDYCVNCAARWTRSAWFMGRLTITIT